MDNSKINIKPHVQAAAPEFGIEIVNPSDLILQFISAYTTYSNMVLDYGDGMFYSMVEAHTLIWICNHPGVTISQLAVHFTRTKSALSQTVKKLAEKDLVRREADPKDKKIVHLYVTEAGKAVCLKHLEYDQSEARLTARALDYFSAEELDTFYRVMRLQTAWMQKLIEQINDPDSGALFPPGTEAPRRR